MSCPGSNGFMGCILPPDHDGAHALVDDASDPVETAEALASVAAVGGGALETGEAVRVVDAVEFEAQRDLFKLARLVAAGILRTRQTEDGMIVERVPESRAAKAKRLERKRKRHLKRRAGK